MAALSVLGWNGLLGLCFFVFPVLFLIACQHSLLVSLRPMGVAGFFGVAVFLL